MAQRPGRIDVVGAGAWGLSAALALLESGAKDVCVWERSQPGTGATGRAAGLVSTHLRQESDIRLVLETRRRLLALRQWGARLDIAAAKSVYHSPGSLTTVASGERDRLERLAKRLRTVGGRFELLEARDLKRQKWPLADVEDLFAIHSEEDGYVEAQDLVDLLRARIVRLGGKVRPDSPVRLRIEGDACVGLEAGADFVESDHVLVAAGAWSKELLARSRLPLPIKPYRTQLAQIEYPSENMPVYHDTSLFVYARPDGPNRILVGDGTEHVETTPDTFNAAVDAPFVEKVAASVATRWKDGGDARFRTGWAGLCVASPDRDPLIGPYPKVDGLFVMVGDNGFGVMRALALGQVAADQVLAKEGVTNPYRPSRVHFDEDFEVREGFEL